MDKKRLKSIVINLILIVAFVFVMSFNTTGLLSAEKDITYNEFLTMVEQGRVDSVEIGSSQLNIKVLDDNTVYHTGILEHEELVSILYEAGITFKQVEESPGAGEIALSLLLNFGPWVLLFIVFRSIMSSAGGGGGILNVGKSKATMNINKNTGVTFEDVAGQEEAKEQLTEIIDYLHNPKKYQAIGAKIPKGALLVGPPGTGKTLLAKAVAGEAGVPFFSVTGSDFVEMFVGVGASRIRDLFEQAKQNAPCIIFIDEVDSIAKSRDGASRHSGGNDEREQTLNQLLSEMDGFDSSKGIIILAATNRPEILDKAFLRAGRFDRKVIVERPDLKGRIETLKVHSKNVKLDSTVDFKAIAYATTGSVGADLENIVNEAALIAVKLGKKAVSQSDLMEAVETVFAGKQKKDRIMSDKERQLVAYHEVGHAVVSAMQKNTSPVQKITIVPRTKGSLGYTLQIPEEEKYLSSKDEMLADITTFLGGRCAEEIIFNTITTGASNDIERATEIARQMITIYGMSDKFDMVALENIQSRYLDGSFVRNCSESTSTEVDKEIYSIIKACHEKAKNIIRNNRDLMDEVADYLLKNESITGEEFMDIFNKYYPKGVPSDLSSPVKPIREPRTEVPAPKKEIKEPVKERVLTTEKAPEKQVIVEEKPKVVEEQPKKIVETPIPQKSEPKFEAPKQEVREEIKHPEPPKEVKKEEVVKEKVVEVEPPKAEPKKEEPKKEEPKQEKPIRIDRPSASVLGPQKNKNKKPKSKNKATATDMQNLLDSVQKQNDAKKKLYEETSEEPKETKVEEKPVVAESAPPAKRANPADYANGDDDMDDITEDMF